MKTKIVAFTLLTSLFVGQLFAQDRTTVNATSSEISDNLDLRAVASIFGDSENLDDFERRLNDPKVQISNLDLNQDNQVDYLRVIESVEGNTHIIILQSVLGRDVFQDVATIEVERDRHNNVQVQVVGDVYMYGNNYIYEPVYVHTPVIYTNFWVSNYHPYYSSWYWGYYPTYYYAWNPFPIFSYRNHIGLCINFNYSYNYVNYRRCNVAYNNYYGRRGNGYERQYPTRSFSSRNSGYANRYELDRTRNIRSVGTTRSDVANNSNFTRGNSMEKRNENTREVASIRNGNTRSDDIPRGYSTTRNENTRINDIPRGNSPIRNENTRSIDIPRENPTTRIENTRSNDIPRGNSSTREYTRSNYIPRENPITRGENTRNNDIPRGNPITRNENIRSNDFPRGNSSTTIAPMRNISSQNGNQGGSSQREFSQRSDASPRGLSSPSQRSESQRGNGRSNRG